MDNKKILKQILKIDNKADIDHTHDGFLSQDDLPTGGYSAINIRADEWIQSDDGHYYYVNVEHNLGTKEIITEAVSSTGNLLMIGYNSIGVNQAEIISDEAIDITVTVMHRAEPNSLVGFNPINDNIISSLQTWSSKKLNEEIRKITGSNGAGTGDSTIDNQKIESLQQEINTLKAETSILKQEMSEVKQGAVNSQQEFNSFKEEVYNKMNNLVSYEADNIFYSYEESSCDNNEIHILKELQKEKELRMNLEERILRLEKLLNFK